MRRPMSDPAVIMDLELLVSACPYCVAVRAASPVRGRRRLEKCPRYDMRNGEQHPVWEMGEEVQL